ncbi:MAG: DUF1311 domain-containing protein [Flavobacterium sp.]
MRAETFFLVAFFFITSLSFGQTQAKMNEAVSGNYEKADKELNIVYNKILKMYKSDTEFIKNLKNSQKIWVKFRDAEMKVKYPERKEGYYGSIQPLCWSNYMAELTKKRTRDLRIWLNGVEEGDSCAGSVKVN